MNGTWLAFFTLIMIVLIAVAVGSQQMEAQKDLQISQLMSSRDEAVNIALEAKHQREVAFKVRDEAVAKVDGLNAKIAEQQGMLDQVSLELQNEKASAANSQEENKRLQAEANALRTQVSDLQTKYTALDAAYTQFRKEAQIVVTGNESAVTEESGSAVEQTYSLPVQMTDLPGQLGLGLAILGGMAALGSGGYIYYRQDPSRKYTVKMTKEQIRDYARYQRERGNKAA
jgi:hypothetical protein